jgi:hypothetical protein
VYTRVKRVLLSEQKGTIMKHDLSSNEGPRRTTVTAGQKANTEKKNIIYSMDSENYGVNYFFQ